MALDEESQQPTIKLPKYESVANVSLFCLVKNFLKMLNINSLDSGGIQTFRKSKISKFGSDLFVFGGPKWVRNGLWSSFQHPKRLENEENPLFKTKRHQLLLQTFDFRSVWRHSHISQNQRDLEIPLRHSDLLVWLACPHNVSGTLENVRNNSLRLSVSKNYRFMIKPDVWKIQILKQLFIFFRSKKCFLNVDFRNVWINGDKISCWYDLYSHGLQILNWSDRICQTSYWSENVCFNPEQKR